MLFHLWKRTHRPSFRETRNKENAKLKAEDEKNSRDFVLELLRGDLRSRTSRYGIGEFRELSDFESKLGVFFVERKVASKEVKDTEETFLGCDDENLSSTFSLSSDDKKIAMLRKFLNIDV